MLLYADLFFNASKLFLDHSKPRGEEEVFRKTLRNVFLKHHNRFQNNATVETVLLIM